MSDRLTYFGRKALAVFITMILTVALTPQPIIDALSDCQKQLIDSGVYYFNCEGDIVQCGNSTFLPGNTNEEKIWNYLVGVMGLNNTQAAGVMGNIQQESGFSPTALNTSSGAYGIIQWYAGRKTGLQNFARDQGKDPSDLSVQLDFMKLELEGSYYKPRVLDPIKAAATLEEATRIWLEKFEIPCIAGSHECDVEMGIRLPNATNWLNQFGSGAGGSTNALGSIGCTGGQIVGGLSLPTDRSYYDEHVDYFTKPHHDYPAADIPMPEGTPIYSMTAGRVFSANQGGKCGIGITIETAEGVRFNYCHGIDGGSIPGAAGGDNVTAGQLIMHSGNTGNSSGPHLHLGIKTPDGTDRCPQSLFVGIAEGSPPNILTLPSSGCSY